jgi:hypothetical protein
MSRFQSARHPMLNVGGDRAVNIVFSNSTITLAPGHHDERATSSSERPRHGFEALLAAIESISSSAIHALTWHLAIRVAGAIFLSVLLLIHGDRRHDESETQLPSAWVVLASNPHRLIIELLAKSDLIR